MAHQPKPFFRTGRGWFVQLGKQQIKLYDGPKKTATEKFAWAEFYKLMAAREAAPPRQKSREIRPKNRKVAEATTEFLDRPARRTGSRKSQNSLFSR